MSLKLLTCTPWRKGELCTLRSVHWKRTRFKGDDHEVSTGFAELEINLKHSCAEVDVAIRYIMGHTSEEKYELEL